jgi:alpha-ribazole phosphatase/probable phosphoglycerate mutase
MAGWADFPLTELGVDQASALASRLFHEQRPSTIVSSPLQRAVCTATIVSERLSCGPVALEPGFREIGCGDVDGWPTQRVQERYPREWDANLRQLDPDFRWPGGESYREFRDRVVGTLGRIAEQHPSQRVLVVTHAGVISQIVGYVRGDSPARWESFRPRNATITQVEWHAGKLRLVRFDDRGGSAC